MESGKATFRRSFPQNSPRHHRLGKSLEFERSEVFAHEHIAEQPKRAGGDDRGVRGYHALQASGEVRSPPDDDLLLCRILSDSIPGDDHARCNSNPHLQRLSIWEQKLAHLCHELEAGPNGPFSIVLVRLRVAEIHKKTVAHEAGDVPAHLRDHRRTASLEPADHLAQILGIKRDRQRRRADEIAKEDRNLPSLGF